MAFNISEEQFAAVNAEANAPREFTPVPDGRYCASIVQVDDKQRTANNGNVIDSLNFQVKLEGGQYNNRREFVDLAYSNSGSEAHGQIGIKQICSLWSAVGGAGAPSTAAFAGKVGTKFELVIKTTPSKNPQYGPNRNFYFNPCSEDCQVEDTSFPPADGGDIWS